MGGFFGGGGGASVDLASPSAIGSTTPNTGAFTTLSANNGTITTSSPAFTLAQTWNAGAQTFTALRVNATDTASASGSLLMDLRIGASSVYSFGKGTLKIQAPSGIASTLAIYATSTNSNTGTSGPNCLDIFNSSGTRTACIRQDGLIASSFIGTVDDSSVTLVDSSGAAANYPSGVNVGANSLVGWSSNSNWWGAKDVALRRNSAGVLEVNNGNSGTFRDLIVRNFRMSAPTGVPTANNSTGTEGSIRWDADYIYICTATNTWKRVAIATWP